jgi:hypothetical protein
VDVLAFNQSIRAQRALPPSAEIHDPVPGVDLLPRFIRHLNMRDAAKATLWQIMNV